MLILYNRTKGCSCTRKIHSDYCDNIATLFESTKKTIILKEKEAKSQYDIIFKMECYDKEEDENRKQIDKDVGRTFPKYEFFKSDEGKLKLTNVLIAFSKYDKEISKRNNLIK